MESLSWFETWPEFGLDGIVTEDDISSSHETTSITYRHEFSIQEKRVQDYLETTSKYRPPYEGVGPCKHLGQQETARGAAFMSCAL